MRFVRALQILSICGGISFFIHLMRIPPRDCGEPRVGLRDEYFPIFDQRPRPPAYTARKLAFVKSTQASAS